MPLGRSRKRLSQLSLLRPYSAMSSQLSAHAITAHTAITKISLRRWSILPTIRGSSSSENCSTKPATDICISPFHAEGLTDTAATGFEFHALPLGHTVPDRSSLPSQEA